MSDSEIVGLNSIPQSLNPSTPQPLNPSIPQSLLDIPPEDPPVYDMICAADTVGVFQIESRAQMSMLPRLRPRCFYDLVIEVAIVRPGPIQGGMVHPYLRRRAGREPVTYPSKEVEKVLGRTLGVPIFQEQVMKLAVVAAGFTPGEADQLRRSMAAWRRNGAIEKFQTKLIRGMLANGYSKEFAEQIYMQIRGFGEYGFPESHSASFSLLVYASAWLKRYHPAAFCAAMINAQPLGFYTPGQLVRDALAHGVPVRPVDVNWSGWDCSLERDGGTEGRRDGEDLAIGRFGDLAIDGGADSNHQITSTWGQGGPAVRLGMRLIRGLSEEKVRPLLMRRDAGTQGRRDEVRDSSTPSAPSSLRPCVPASLFTSFRQLARQPGVSRDTLLRLAAADAFRSLGLSRRQALWEILALDSEEGTKARRHEGTKARRREGEGAEQRAQGADSPSSLHRSVASSLFSSLCPSVPPSLRPSLFSELEPDEPAAPLPTMSLDETVVRDYDAIGFSLNAHPIGLIRAELDAMELSEGSRGIEGAREQGGKGSRTAAKRRAGLRVVAAETLRRMRNGQPVAVAGLVTCRQRPGTAKGVVFITLEDETGMANLIVRPNVWDEYRHIARGRVALLVSGHIERQGEVIHVMTRRFHDLSALLGGLKHASRDFH